MPANVLVIVVDGLRASALGAFGNTSFATPALDHFAAESLLLDWCYAPSPDLPENYRAIWNSIHPVHSHDSTGRKASAGPSPSLPQLFANNGYATTLITDEPLLNSLAPTADFHETVQIPNAPKAIEQAHRATDPSRTELASLFTAAIDTIEHRTPNKPRLLWLHARGMYGAWDAPLAFQQSLLDDGDPPPIESSTPPDFVVQSKDDPDAAFRYACAYAAQVMVLDACVENILEAVRAATGDEWLVMLMGARGFPLGEHGRIGGIDPRLYADQLHVPWLIRFPGNLGRLARSGALTSHVDVLPTLIDWMCGGAKFDGLAIDGSSVLPLASVARTSWRDAIISTECNSATTPSHPPRRPCLHPSCTFAPTIDGKQTTLPNSALK